MIQAQLFGGVEIETTLDRFGENIAREFLVHGHAKGCRDVAGQDALIPGIALGSHADAKARHQIIEKRFKMVRTKNDERGGLGGA